MNIDRARAKSLFLSAADLPAAERATYLDRECGTDMLLRARVESLLKADEGFENTPAAIDNSPETTGPQPPAVANGRGSTGSGNSFVAGQVIAGRYTLNAVLGEGGMGTVYEAEQTEPIRRKVALKLIKPGMDTRQVVSRFNGERQALALMNHPNIARVYDGGTTESGQPYFVMELVVGVPLTQYCDRARLSVQERLELFVSVCLAVHHAHKAGIIHRDLKPNNILVTEVDGQPTPKVIDFGLARPIEPDLLGRSLIETGAIIGTPAYMAPEQAELSSSLQIDPRTDVYALGVMLYELLTGSPPLSSDQFGRAALLEMLRMVRDVDPPWPSTRVGSSLDLSGVAATRNIDPDRLKRQLRGDLDWIVMKALEKDRSRRYASATSFAADILRHLACDPVLAAPPSRAYRLRRFLRKNRRAVVVVSSLLLALLLGAAGTGYGLSRAERARVLAIEQEARAKLDRKLAADREAELQLDRNRALAQEVAEQDPGGIKPRPRIVGLGFDGPRGAAVDAAGNIYVADTRADSVKRVSPDGKVRVIGSGFSRPFGVAVGPAGKVVVADTGNNAVKVVSPDGTVTSIGSGFANPWAVAVDSGGNVLVADAGNDAVKQIRPDGTIRTIGSGFHHPEAMAVDRAGNLYVADYGHDAIKKVLPDGAIQNIGAAVTRPCAVAVDAAGNVFFAEAGRNPVTEMLTDGSTKYIVTDLNTPTGIAVDPAGNVIICARGGNEVVKLSPPTPGPTTSPVVAASTEPVPPFSVQTRIGPGFHGPNALAIDNAGNLLVSENFGEVVRRMLPDGSSEVIGGRKLHTNGVRVDAAGNIFIANGYGDTLYRVSPDGVVTSIHPEQARDPVSIAPEPSGNLLIANRVRGNIEEISPDGKFIRFVISGLREPFDVVLAPSGNIFVTEKGNNAVKEFTLSGTLVRTIAAKEPFKVAVDSKGNVFVACAGDGTIREFLPNGESIVLLSGVNDPIGVAVDADGRVYACALWGNQVYEIPPRPTTAPSAK